MSFTNINGKITAAEAALISPDNSAFRYGVGLFETMLVQDGAILLAQYHMDRLFAGMQQLGFVLPPRFSPEVLLKEVQRTVSKNQWQALCRVRLQVFAGSGGIFGPDSKTANYVIECYHLEPEATTLNENGLIVGLATDVCKSIDSTSNLKSANALVYAMAGKIAKANKWNDALICNQHGNIIESVIANIFVVKNGHISTPPLSDGCVAGVMRRHLLHTQPAIAERPITMADMLGADEVFLTNAIKGIKWVRRFHNTEYDNNITRKLASEVR